MLIDGQNCKFVAKVASDGRIYNGVWLATDHDADFFPPGTVIFDTFPTDDTAKDGGSDYKWDGEHLIYDPVSDEERERRRQEILAEYAAKYGSGGDA